MFIDPPPITWQLSLRFLSCKELLRSVQLVDKHLHELVHSRFQVKERWEKVEGTLVEWHRRSCARCDQINTPMCSMHLHCIQPRTHTLCLSCIHDIAGTRIKKPCAYMYQRSYCQECFVPLSVKHRCPGKYCMYTVCKSCLFKFHQRCPICHHSFRNLRYAAQVKEPVARVAETTIKYSNCPCLSIIFVLALIGVGYVQCAIYFVPTACENYDVVHLMLFGYVIMLGLLCVGNAISHIGKCVYYAYIHLRPQ